HTRQRGAPGGAKPVPAGRLPPRPSPWHELKEGAAYVWNSPLLLAAMCLALLLNMTTFPLMNHVLPYVAKVVYGADQRTLGYMAAGAATGALLTSLMLSRLAHAIRPARVSVVGTICWYAALSGFAWAPTPWIGIPLLFLAGCSQSLSQVPMHAVL